MNDDVLVVVPMFNEAHTIGAVVSDLLTAFPHVVCIDDGSTDDSAEIASGAGAKVVRHAVNLGQGAALQTGFDYLIKHSEARYCVTFDADGQHRIQDAVSMVEHARSSGVEVVLASRFLGSTVGMPTSRRLTLRAAVRFSRWFDGLDVTDTHNGLRVLDRAVVSSFRLSLPRMAHASELLSAIHSLGLTYVEVPVEVTYTEYSRRKGQSSLDAVNVVFDLVTGKLRTAR